MAQLAFTDFICCFRKQFLLQKGRGANQHQQRESRRTSPYYTNYNQEQHLKNDEWGMMVFIYTGCLFGFTDKEMRAELKISKETYETLRVAGKMVIRNRYTDKVLHDKVLTKVQLIKNVVLNNYLIRPAFYDALRCAV
jgi:hypothetical protein